MPVIHFRPTDSKESEVWQQEFNKDVITEKNSAFVREIPEPVSQVGKTHTLFINLNDNTLFYKYEDRPLTAEEELAQLKEQYAMMQTAIDDLIFGGGF